MISVALIALVVALSPLIAGGGSFQIWVGPWHLSEAPDQALWAPLLDAILLIAAAVALLVPKQAPFPSPPRVRRPIVLMGVFALLCIVSLLYHWLGVHHGRIQFMDAMLRQTGAYLAIVALAACLSRVGASRFPVYLVVIALLLGATFASLIGLQDFLGHLAAGDKGWREFATSTPDYFAALLTVTIPITLALLIGALGRSEAADAAPPGQASAAPGTVMLGGRPTKISGLIYAIALLIQLPVLAATGSRFALISLLLGIALLAAGMAVAERAGAELPKISRNTSLALLLVVLLVGALGAKSVVGRLMGPAARAQTNSAMFRVYTWKASERLADKHPWLGSGPGTFVYAFQRRAIAGYTTVAHNSYIQAITDTGYPAGIILAVALIYTLVTGFRAIGAPMEPPRVVVADPPAAGRKRGKSDEAANCRPTRSERFLALLAAPDDRFLIAGLASGFGAGLLQNLIDSDWYIPFDATALWAVAGLLLAFARRGATVADGSLQMPTATTANTRVADKATSTPLRQMRALLPATVYCLAAIGLIALHVAQRDADNATAALAAGDTSGALDGYQSAIAINPARGKYYSDLGMLVYPRIGDSPRAESALKQAIAVEPSGTNYRRLGKLYMSQNRPADALTEFVLGLEREPNDLELHLLCAQARIAIGDKAGALNDFRTLAAGENEPLGRYPAIGDLVEIRFAEADVPLGDDALAMAKYPVAIGFYNRARKRLDRYIDEGGSMNAMRQLMLGGSPDPDYDMKMHALYDDAMTGLVQSYKATGHPTDAANAAAELAAKDPAFDKIITAARKASPG